MNCCYYCCLNPHIQTPQIAYIQAHEGSVSAVYCDPDQVLVSGGKDGKVNVWSAGLEPMKTFDVSAPQFGSSNCRISSVCLQRYYIPPVLSCLLFISRVFSLTTIQAVHTACSPDPCLASAACCSWAPVALRCTSGTLLRRSRLPPRCCR